MVAVAAMTGQEQIMYELVKERIKSVSTEFVEKVSRLFDSELSKRDDVSLISSRKHNMYKSSLMSSNGAKLAILHHTAGSTLKGAEDTLVKRGLGYNYMIDKDGKIYEYENPSRQVRHAYGNNFGTIGIAYVGGGKYGAINSIQLNKLVKLLNYLRITYKLESIVGHKNADSRGWKIDPRWPGEPADGTNKEINDKYMDRLAKKTGLKRVVR